MKEVTGGYVTQDGRYFEDRTAAEKYELRTELETAASTKMGYSVHKCIDYLYANFDITRKTAK